MSRSIRVRCECGSSDQAELIETMARGVRCADWMLPPPGWAVLLGPGLLCVRCPSCAEPPGTRGPASTLTLTVTDDDVRQLRAEAEIAGDLELEATCRRALEGDSAALYEVHEDIRAAFEGAIEP